MKANHYIDNKEFYRIIVEHKETINRLRDAGKDLPKMPESLGKFFFDLCEHMSRRPEFINYSYREDMIGKAYENCIQYWYTYDGTKSTNPFGYFSRVVYNAFIRYIGEEKKETYIKYKMAFNSGVLDSDQTLTDSDGRLIIKEGLADNMYDFVHLYEQKIRDKKAEKAKKQIKVAKKK